jgi:DNA-binding SARP family transcriptional activator/predicted negative regulator of RcsB-dependent stress response
MRPSKQSTLLAKLLVSANQVVSVTDLVDAVWDERPPRSGAPAVHTSISRLRQLLNSTESGGAERIATGPKGYLLQIAANELDANVFHRRVRQAKQLLVSGKATAADDELRQALRLWRGDVLSGIPGRFAESYAAQLDESRLSAVEDLAATRLTIGADAELVSELRGLVAEHPFRERPRGQLMLALYRLGRPDESLAVFREARQILIEQLGIEPGVELQRLHSQILDRDPRLRAGRPGTTVTSGAPVIEMPPVPRQLPADTLHFVGREAELARMDSMRPHGSTDPAGSTPRSTLCVIDGPAGIGKTAFAVHWATRAHASCPDGELYVDLHGFDATRSPTGPADALDQMLRALNVAPGAIPRGLDEQAALYRTVLADRRVLIVLDNAAGAEQVRPLLPGSASCVVLVTSRNRLSALVAREGATRITLGQLTEDKSAELLTRIIGVERAGAGQDALHQLGELCAHLPLALRMTAERLVTHPHTSAGDLVEDITDQQDRLAALAADEEDTSSLRALFSWSYNALDIEAAELYCLLGPQPGHDIGLPAAAALLGTTVRQAGRVLDRLTGVHLVDESAYHRFRLHDLLRDYAIERAHVDRPPSELTAALTRLCGWYLRTASNAADRILPPKRPRRALPVDLPPCTPLMFATSQQALAWCELERHNLIAVVSYCADQGLDLIANQLPAALWTFFEVRGYLSDWITTHRLALRSARRLDDARLEAPTLSNLGTGYLGLRQFDQAMDCYRRAHELAAGVGDRWLAAASVANLGEAFRRSGQVAEAIDHYSLALELATDFGDRWVMKFALNSLADAFCALGQYRRAVDTYQRVLVMHRDLEDQHWEGKCLAGLGDAYRGLDQDPAAADSYRAALAVYREVTDRAGVARVSYRVGEVLAEFGDHAAARTHWQEALEIFEQLNDPVAAERIRLRLSGRTDPVVGDV